MKIIWIILALSSSLFAQDKNSLEITIKSFKYNKPVRGVGRAGELKFTSASFNRGDIVMDVENKNNIFDAILFVRPTFLGFQTQFGNFGYSINKGSNLVRIVKSEAEEASLILNEEQLNFSGSRFQLTFPDTSMELKKFRVFCKGNGDREEGETQSSAIMEDCFEHMSVNNSYLGQNSDVELNVSTEEAGEKVSVAATFKNFEMRKEKAWGTVEKLRTNKNGNYFIETGAVNFECAKDPELKEVDFEKIKIDCMEQAKVEKIRVKIQDNEEGTKFDLDIKSAQVKDGVLYGVMPSGTISDSEGQTSLNGLILNCSKNHKSDLFEIDQVIDGCLKMTKLQIRQIVSNRPDKADSFFSYLWQKVKDVVKNSDSNISKTNNLLIGVSGGNLSVQSDVSILGRAFKANIFGKVSYLKEVKTIAVKVTSAKLPFGINSVKLVMYYLKKDLASKDIKINGNNIYIKI